MHNIVIGLKIRLLCSSFFLWILLIFGSLFLSLCVCTPNSVICKVNMFDGKHGYSSHLISLTSIFQFVQGVMMTHANVLATVSAVMTIVPGLGCNDVYLAYLPLAHILELAAEVCRLQWLVKLLWLIAIVVLRNLYL